MIKDNSGLQKNEQELRRVEEAGSDLEVDSNSNTVSEALDLTAGPYQHLDLNHYNTCQSQIGLTDEDLVTIGTKDLNKKVKHSKNLNTDEILRIKKKRRTMKNRGYAAGCRYNKVETEKSLEVESKELELEITEKKAENQELMEKLSEVKQDNSFMLSYCKAHGIEIPEVLKARVESSQVDENDNEN